MGHLICKGSLCQVCRGLPKAASSCGALLQPLSLCIRPGRAVVHHMPHAWTASMVSQGRLCKVGDGVREEVWRDVADGEGSRGIHCILWSRQAWQRCKLCLELCAPAGMGLAHQRLLTCIEQVEAWL